MKNIKDQILEKIKAELDLRYDIQQGRLIHDKSMLQGMIYAYEEMLRYIDKLDF